MLTASRWAENSQAFALSISSDIINFVYVCLITAILILIHSAFLNKLKITTIRFWTDGSCWSTIFASILLIIESRNPTTINGAFYINLGVYAIFGTTVQLCDNYMTFSRYLVVYPKSSTRFKVAVNLYICIFLILTYMPYETILPCFLDTNSETVMLSNTITAGYIFMIAYLSYNLFFAYKFWKAMHSKVTYGGGSNHKLLMLGTKNLAHIIISSIGVVLQGTEFTYGFAPGGCMSTFFTVNVALHFLFNWKIEKTEFPFKPKFLRSSSGGQHRGSISSYIGMRSERGPGSIMIFSRRQSSLLDSIRSRTSSIAPHRPSGVNIAALLGITGKYQPGLGDSSKRFGDQYPNNTDNNNVLRVQRKDSHTTRYGNNNNNNNNNNINSSNNNINRSTIARGKSRDSYEFHTKDKQRIIRNSVVEVNEEEEEEKKNSSQYSSCKSTHSFKRASSIVNSNRISRIDSSQNVNPTPPLLMRQSSQNNPTPPLFMRQSSQNDTSSTANPSPPLLMRQSSQNNTTTTAATNTGGVYTLTPSSSSSALIKSRRNTDTTTTAHNVTVIKVLEKKVAY